MQPFLWPASRLRKTLLQTFHHRRHHNLCLSNALTSRFENRRKKSRECVVKCVCCGLCALLCVFYIYTYKKAEAQWPCIRVPSPHRLLQLEMVLHMVLAAHSYTFHSSSPKKVTMKGKKASPYFRIDLYLRAERGEGLRLQACTVIDGTFHNKSLESVIAHLLFTIAPKNITQRHPGEYAPYP